MSEKLLPCPFCGSEAEMKCNTGSIYFVKCKDKSCGARTRNFTDNEGGAAYSWNMRQEPDTLGSARRNTHTTEYCDNCEGAVLPTWNKCPWCGAAFGVAAFLAIVAIYLIACVVVWVRERKKDS